MAIGKVNTGGGGSGGTLVVTGVAGDTITATKDGKTYSRTFNSAGKAVFRGLATGIWALTMTNGSQTVTRNVTITADYSLTIAYFMATITVTYPANSTCTCSDGTTTLTDTNTGTSEKTVTFTVPNTGDWTVSCTDGTDTATQTVTISAEGQSVSVTLTYELVLFNGGSVNEDITGGWSGNMAQEQLGDDSYLYLQSYGYYNTMAVTVNKITVTGYDTLKVNVTAYTRNNANAWIGLSNAADEASYKSPVLKISPTASNTPAEYSGDLSKLSGEYYVFVFAEGYFDNVPVAHTCNIKIDKIILA